MKKYLYEASKWLVILALTVVMAIAGAWVKGDVYTKEEVDDEIEEVQTLHDRDIADQQRQLDRIDEGVQKLVDKLIEEE